MALRQAKDAVHWFMSKLGARVVAESGIPSDRLHLGKLILRSLKDAPDFVLQIDASTGESETFGSVLQRSVQCAVAFQELGLKVGDKIVLMAPNHLHLTIPYYAAFYLGIGVAPLDSFLTIEELETMFKTIDPKIIFTQNETSVSIKEALKNAEIKATVVTFDESEHCITFKLLLEQYGQGANVNTFRGADFDPANTIAKLVATSGTTGLSKAAVFTHENTVVGLPYGWICSSKFPTPVRLALLCTPLQWISAGFHFMCSPIFRYTRVQNSASVTPKIFIEIVNKYKPTFTSISPRLLTSETVEKCDFSCFETILIGGGIISKELKDKLQKMSPNTLFLEMYGITESGGMSFYDESPVPGSIGRPVGLFDYRLVNPDTKENITDAHVEGELWIRGPSVCKGYYKQPDVTKETFEEGGWFRTGDIFYRDENYFFFYVDRLKLMLKYQGCKISPLELESVIRQHPAVLDVAVTCILDQATGELPVACVISQPGHDVTAQEIKDLVKKTLNEYKQLRGGVIFMNEFPVTASNKVNRRNLKKIVQNMPRE